MHDLILILTTHTYYSLYTDKETEAKSLAQGHTATVEAKAQYFVSLQNSLPDSVANLLSINIC